MLLVAIESWIAGLGAFAGLTTLAYAILRVFNSLRRPSGREELGARFALRTPVLLAATILFVGVSAVLWRPLPIQPQAWPRVLLLSVSVPLFFGGLGLYLWGIQSLGQMFGPSSGLGVRLYAKHRLVTAGPYAHVRHPMYLGVISTAIGSLLLYRTWATLGFAITMLGLAVRARREEGLLAQEFGTEWNAYASYVPPWFPRLRRRKAGSLKNHKGGRETRS